MWIEILVLQLSRDVQNYFEGSAFDIKTYVNAFTMDVLCSCAFGIDLQSINDPKHPLVENAKKAYSVDLSFSAIVGYIAPQIAKFFKLEGLDREAVEYFKKLTAKIVETRKYRDKTLQSYESDFMQLMIDANQAIEKENIPQIKINGEIFDSV